VLYGALFWASVCYLLYLAAKIALALKAINPKAYAVNTALFSGFGFWPGSPGTEVAVKFLVINAIWIPIHLAWLGLGVTLRRLDLTPPVQRAVNVAMAASMLAVVALAALAPR